MSLNVLHKAQHFPLTLHILHGSIMAVLVLGTLVQEDRTAMRAASVYQGPSVWTIIVQPKLLLADSLIYFGFLGTNFNLELLINTKLMPFSLSTLLPPCSFNYSFYG